MHTFARVVGAAYHKNHNSFSFHSGKKVTNYCSNTCLNNLTFFANSVNHYIPYANMSSLFNLERVINSIIVQISAVIAECTVHVDHPTPV